MRDSVRFTPSMARRSPASPASRGERVSRRVSLVSRTTVATPASAGMNLHPNEESGPNSSMPRPMSHLPSWGCTTNEGSVLSPEKSPCAKGPSEFVTHADSYPLCHRA